MMTSNRLCIITWVYGQKYQGWIPLYIYSIKKHYPEYDIKILTEKKLSLNIERLINKYNLASQAEIIKFEDKCIEYCHNNIEKRCLRWLVNFEELSEKYEYIYIGDIDIYICGEVPSLLEQHKNNMLKLRNRTYSNVVRLSVKDYIKNKKKMDKSLLFRLTGLHFTKTEQYFKNVKRNQEIIKKYLKGKRNKIIDKLFFNDDERCLWLVNLFNGEKYPKGSYQLSDKVFRPYHGVHFAIGRELNIYKKMREESNIKDMHKYFLKFVDDYNADETLRALIWDSPFYILRQISNVCVFWESEFSKNEIRDSKSFLQ